MRKADFTESKRGSKLPFVGTLLSIALAILGGPSDAHAEETYWTTKALLKDFFKSSDSVGYERLETEQHERVLRELLGYVPPKKSYVVFVARTGTSIDGYAVVDEEKGQHEPITFGVKLDARGAVERLEIMVYREGYGSEVREQRFRDQYQGKRSSDRIRTGEDIVAVSGATISSKALSVGVRRAVALTDLLRQKLMLASAPAGVAASH